MKIYVKKLISIFFLFLIFNYMMLYSVAQKVTHYQIIKQIVLNCIKVCHEIRFLRQLKK